MEGGRVAGFASAERAARILFTSGYAETSVTSNERLDRNVAFIQKPFTAAALMRKVRQVLDG